jgi:hypothetical protein
MVRKSGYPSWPPVWTTTRHDKDDKPIGEVGTLEEVVIHELIDNKVFLFIKFQGLRYMGFIAFDDSTFCDQIFTLLKTHIEHPIQEIGDLDVP